MITWTLVIFMHVGMMGNDNANALATVNGFSSEAACSTAGKRTSKLSTGTKANRWVCVEVK